MGGAYRHVRCGSFRGLCDRTFPSAATGKQVTSDRKKPGVTFWATVVVVVALVGYPLSIGPWFWLNASGRSLTLVKCMAPVYQPIHWAGEQSATVKTWLFAYLSLWMPAKPMEYHGE